MSLNMMFNLPKSKKLFYIIKAKASRNFLEFCLILLIIYLVWKEKCAFFFRKFETRNKTIEKEYLQ